MLHHTRTHLFNGLFSRITWVSWHQKGKPLWILMKQEMMGWHWQWLSLTICRSFASCCRQITMPVPHHSSSPAQADIHTTVLLLFWNLSGTTRVSRYQKGKTWKGKTNLDLLEQEIVSGSGICWAICKVCTSSQTTTPTSHHSVFYRPDALPAAQPTASKHWRQFIAQAIQYKRI